VSQHVLARAATIDLCEGFLTIDDVRLPWWLARVDPEIIAGDGAIEVTVTFMVDGAVTVISEFGDERVVDPVLGDPGAWARDHVRTELQRYFPHLEMP
jgi:hypothetical protein